MNAEARPTAAQLFKEAAKALYGDAWRHSMAEELGLNDRSLRRMAEGYSPIPLGVWNDVQRLLMEEGNRLLKMAEQAPRE